MIYGSWTGGFVTNTYRVFKPNRAWERRLEKLPLHFHALWRIWPPSSRSRRSLIWLNTIALGGESTYKKCWRKGPGRGGRGRSWIMQCVVRERVSFKTCKIYIFCSFFFYWWFTLGVHMEEISPWFFFVIDSTSSAVLFFIWGSTTFLWSVDRQGGNFAK